MCSNAIIIHVPHSSTFIPEDERKTILLTESELNNELLRMTDWYVDELFQLNNYDIHKNNLSRLLMDPERFRSDSEEEMSRCGMGALYTKTSDGRILRKIDENQGELLLTKYYDLYHRSFTEKVLNKLEKYGSCYIIDAHSFPSRPLPYKRIKEKNDPIYALGLIVIIFQMKF